MTELFPMPVIIAFLVCCGAALATMIGGLTVFSARESNPRLLAFGLAFAGGAMVYISLVEIFVKSLSSFSQAYDDKTAYSLATLSFFGGVFLIAALDRLIPNPHNELCKPGSSDKNHLKRIGMLAAIAITVHNFPEGMATFFATLDNPAIGTALAFAIAVHNIPEGVSIAIPVYYATGSRKITFLAILLSALAEPVGALIGYLVLAPYLGPVTFGAVFGVIAGVMVFLSLDELLPAAKRYATKHDAVYGMILGMGCIALSLFLFR
jgi:ZIP family zinc transporter